MREIYRGKQTARAWLRDRLMQETEVEKNIILADAVAAGFHPSTILTIRRDLPIGYRLAGFSSDKQSFWHIAR